MAQHTKHMKHPAKQLRLGVYSGAFDPVHTGHITFALQALRLANLDEVIFLPERRPRSKPGVEHYAHRVAMLKHALAPHPALAVMETVDRHAAVRRTLPQLRGLFPEATLVFLMGADTALTVPSWPGAARLLATSELVIGTRSQQQADQTEAVIRSWDTLPAALAIVQSFAPEVSSSAIRHALRQDQPAHGLLASVKRYARQEWLYVSAV